MPSPIMIMGIMACGKSRMGEEIARQRGGVFIEGDAWHPDANIAKMQAGLPLEDADRWPWLDRLASEVSRVAQSDQQVFFSCSALKAIYRNRLRARLPGLITVCLIVDGETAAARSAERSEHFMPTDLVDSQLEAFERPAGEPQTLLVDAMTDFDSVLAHVLRDLERLG